MRPHTSAPGLQTLHPLNVSDCVCSSVRAFCEMTENLIHIHNTTQYVQFPQNLSKQTNPRTHTINALADLHDTQRFTIMTAIHSYILIPWNTSSIFRGFSSASKRVMLLLLLFWSNGGMRARGHLWHSLARPGCMRIPVRVGILVCGLCI